MRDCKTVDTEQWRNYYNVMAESDAEARYRMTEFLHRHNLFKQFLHEYNTYDPKDREANP